MLNLNFGFTTSIFILWFRFDLEPTSLGLRCKMRPWLAILSMSLGLPYGPSAWKLERFSILPKCSTNSVSSWTFLLLILLAHWVHLRSFTVKTLYYLSKSKLNIYLYIFYILLPLSCTDFHPYFYKFWRGGGNTQPLLVGLNKPICLGMRPTLKSFVELRPSHLLE